MLEEELLERKLTLVKERSKIAEDKDNKLYKDEEHVKVSWKTYKKYIKACGGFIKLTFIIIMSFVVAFFM